MLFVVLKRSFQVIDDFVFKRFWFQNGGLWAEAEGPGFEFLGVVEVDFQHHAAVFFFLQFLRGVPGLFLHVAGGFRREADADFFWFFRC